MTLTAAIILSMAVTAALSYWAWRFPARFPRVATLAAAGRSNKDIAAELFMSVHTVGAHLSHVYRKLGIRSRTELKDQLSKLTSQSAKPTGEAAKL